MRRKSLVKEKVFTLPTEKSIPCEELGDYSFLLYGEKKIGKTTLAAQFPEAYFLMFEPGGKSLSVYQTQVDDWETFVSVLNALTQEPDQFQTIVLDTCWHAYQKCFEYMCKELGIKHPQDERDFGKSWGLIRAEFSSQMDRLLKLGRGVIFIAHSDIVEVETRHGTKFHRVQPMVAKQAMEYFTATVDVIGYYQYYGSERILQVDGDDFVVAGNRIDNHFRTPDGKRIVEIPMGNSAEQAYANLLNAYANQQTRSTITDGEAVRPSAKRHGSDVEESEEGSGSQSGRKRRRRQV